MALKTTESFIDADRLTLQIKEYAAQCKLGRTVLDSLEFESREDFLTKEMVYKFSASLLSDKLVDDTYKKRYQYEVYSSWWQHFKHDYMPKWFISRYPVKKTRKSGYATIKFTRYAEYPKANVALQKNWRAYHVMLGGFERVVDTVEDYS